VYLQKKKGQNQCPKKVQLRSLEWLAPAQLFLFILTFYPRKKMPINLIALTCTHQIKGYVKIRLGKNNCGKYFLCSLPKQKQKPKTVAFGF
jgi:hypothetical protein